MRFWTGPSFLVLEMLEGYQAPLVIGNGQMVVQELVF